MAYIAATAHHANTPENYLSPVFPRYYSCDDNVDRLIYFNPSGVSAPKRCFNELIASRLGEMVGAPFLLVEVVNVPSGVVADLVGQPWDGSFDIAGDHVGFEKPGSIVPLRLDHLQSEIVNLSEVASALAVDGWLDGYHGLSYLDDESRVWYGWHAEAFSGIWNLGGTQWTPDTLEYIPWRFNWRLLGMSRAGGLFSHTIAGYLSLKTNRDALLAAGEAVASISSAAIHEAVYDGIPDSWDIPSEDLEACEARLLAMQPLLVDMLERSMFRDIKLYPSDP